MRLAVALVSSLVAASALAAPLAIISDQQGRPLLSASGERLVYGATATPRAERELPASPRLPAPPARPLAVDPALMREDGVIGSYAQVLGRAGIHVLDADGDSQQEILVGHSMMFYLLAFDPSVNGYVQTWFHETGTGATFGGGGIVELMPGDVDGDGALEVVVLRDDGSIDVHDAATGALEGRQALGVTSPAGLALANTEGGAEQEIVVVNASTLHVFRFGTPAALWTLAGAGGVDVATGLMDADPAVEIAVAKGTGTAAPVVDAATRAAQWTNPTGFGTYVDAGDVDGDGRDELAMVEEWNDYELWDVDTTTLKWSGPNFNTSAIRVVDTDGDGRAEVLIGDKQWGDVRVLDGISGAQALTIPNPEHSVSYVHAGDPDRDCSPDIVWGAGYTSTGSDRLYVADMATRVREWENLENDGPMHSFVVADADGDGRADVIRGCNESDASYDGSLVFVTDFHHRRDTHVPTAATNDGWMVTRGMAAGQLDADPAAEYVMNDSRTYTGRISALDGVTHARQWSTVGYDGENVQSVALGDVDGDGAPEVAWGTGKEHTGATGIHVRIVRGDDGTLVWQSPSLSGGWDEVLDLRLADVDADPAGEIVAVVSAVGIRVWDGVTRALEWAQPLANVNALDVGDVDDDGDLDIVVGTTAGALSAYDGTTHAPIFSQSISSSAIHAITVADVDRDAVPDITLTQGASDASTVQIRRASDRVLLWESPLLTGQAGSASSLRVADADDDGALEIVVSTAHAVRAFEYADGPADAAPPTWDGAPGVAGLASIVTPDCCPAVDVTWGQATDALRPPIGYEVHRSTTPGFAPGPTTLVARTGRLAFRDEAVAPATTYHYRVLALDAGGRRDANATERAIRTIEATPPAAPTSVTAADQDACRADGVVITFTHDGLPPGVTYDLFRDGVRVATGVTSPHVHAPGDAAAHDYAVEAVHPSCPLATRSAAARAADASSSVVAPVITAVTDESDCWYSYVTVTFTHPGLGSGHYELIVDGALAASPVSSPTSHVTGDALVHDFQVRAVDEACASSATSAVVQGQDVARSIEPAVITTITDTDSCAAGSARVFFTHPGFPGAGHFELWRDGVAHQSPVVSGDAFPPIDLAFHDYTIVPFDDDCVAIGPPSAAYPYADDAGAGTPPVNVTLTDLAPCDASSARLTFIHPGFSGTGHYELWRDGVAFLSPVVNGAVFFPGDSSPHDWLVRAVDETCGSQADSAVITYGDGAVSVDAAVITAIDDVDPCSASDLVVRFTHAGFGSGSGHHELWRDGALLLASVTDGAAFPPGDAAPHDYVVRSMDDGCARSADSAPVTAADGAVTVAAPVITSIDDRDPCALTGMTLTFTHPGLGAGGRYDLYEDGALVASGITSPQPVPGGAGAPRDYVVRAVDAACGFADSAPVAAQDGAMACVPGTSTVFVARDAAGLVLTWTAATDAAWYDAYVGTIASLATTGAYDHVPDPAGVTFPDARAIASGCDVASGASLTARVQGLAASDVYILLVAAGATGIEGSFGLRSIAPFERRDPSVDPRPASTFCP